MKGEKQSEQNCCLWGKVKGLTQCGSKFLQVNKLSQNITTLHIVTGSIIHCNESELVIIILLCPIFFHLVKLMCRQRLSININIYLPVPGLDHFLFKRPAAALKVML